MHALPYTRADLSAKNSGRIFSTGSAVTQTSNSSAGELAYAGGGRLARDLHSRMREILASRAVLTRARRARAREVRNFLIIVIAGKRDSRATTAREAVAI